jgi:phage FluMu protein Com
MTTETFFCPKCYAIRKFTITSGGMAHCAKGCTFFEKDLIKMKPKGDE